MVYPIFQPQQLLLLKIFATKALTSRSVVSLQNRRNERPLFKFSFKVTFTCPEVGRSSFVKDGIHFYIGIVSLAPTY